MLVKILTEDQNFKNKVKEDRIRHVQDKVKEKFLAEKIAKGDRADSPSTKARYLVLCENHIMSLID